MVEPMHFSCRCRSLCQAVRIEAVLVFEPCNDFQRAAVSVEPPILCNELLAGRLIQHAESTVLKQIEILEYRARRGRTAECAQMRFEGRLAHGCCSVAE